MQEKSMIKQIFWGERGNFCEIPLSRSCKDSEKAMFEAMDKMTDTVDDKDKKLLNETFDCIAAANGEYSYDFFAEGFKIGLLLGMEIAEGKVSR